MISLINNRVVVSSAVCYSMSKTFDDQESWDDNTKKVWENLNTDYKDFFTDEQEAVSNLEKLANIAKIEEIIANVKSKKEQILEKRKEEFINTKKKALLEYKTELKQGIKKRYQKIESTDINEIREEKQALEKSKAEAIERANKRYKVIIEELKIEFDGKKRPESLIKGSKGHIKGFQAEETREKYHGLKKVFRAIFHAHENKYETVKTIRAGAVRNMLDEFTGKVESYVDDETRGKKEKLYKEIRDTLMSEVKDDKLDKDTLSITILRALTSFSDPDISYNDKFPDTLKKDWPLEGWEAEEFVKCAQNYLTELNKRANNDIKKYKKTLIKALEEENIGGRIFAKYSEEIEQLESDIKDKELSLARLNNILKEFDNINE